MVAVLGLKRYLLVSYPLVLPCFRIRDTNSVCVRSCLVSQMMMYNNNIVMKVWSCRLQGMPFVSKLFVSTSNRRSVVTVCAV